MFFCSTFDEYRWINVVLSVVIFEYESATFPLSCDFDMMMSSRRRVMKVEIDI